MRGVCLDVGCPKRWAELAEPNCFAMRVSGISVAFGALGAVPSVEPYPAAGQGRGQTPGAFAGRLSVCAWISA